MWVESDIKLGWDGWPHPREFGGLGDMNKLSLPPFLSKDLSISHRPFLCGNQASCLESPSLRVRYHQSKPWNMTFNRFIGGLSYHKTMKAVCLYYRHIWIDVHNWISNSFRFILLCCSRCLLCGLSDYIVDLALWHSIWSKNIVTQMVPKGELYVSQALTLRAETRPVALAFLRSSDPKTTVIPQLKRRQLAQKQLAQYSSLK